MITSVLGMIFHLQLGLLLWLMIYLQNFKFLSLSITVKKIGKSTQNIEDELIWR